MPAPPRRWVNPSGSGNFGRRCPKFAPWVVIENCRHDEGSTVSTVQWHELGEVGVRLSHICAVSIVKPNGADGFGYTVHMIGGQNFNILFGEQSAAETSRDKLIQILADLVPG